MLFDRYLTARRADPVARVFAGVLPRHQVMSTDEIAQAIHVPVLSETAEGRERAAVLETAQAMARQDEWPEIARLIAEADRARATTQGGRPIATLIAEGARADAVNPVLSGPRAALRPDEALDMLEDTLDEYADRWPVAAIVAMAHIDIAWAWRGSDWADRTDPAALARFRQHMRRATAIIDGFDPFTTNSALLAAVRCALLAGRDAQADRVADDFEDLIDLDPHNPAHMQALGVALLPRWGGDYARLDSEARRTADRTADIWGAGAYAWVYLHAICVDDAVLDFLDADLFLSAVADILERRRDQHTANLWAAFFGTTMQTRSGRALQGPRALEARARLSAGLSWVVHRHLREVHPLVWSDAANRFVPQPGLACADEETARGRDFAFRALARLFRSDLDDNRRIVIGPLGPRLA